MLDLKSNSNFLVPLAFSSSTNTAYSAYRHETETDSSGAPLLLWRATQNKNTAGWNLNSSWLPLLYFWNLPFWCYWLEHLVILSDWVQRSGCFALKIWTFFICELFLLVVFIPIWYLVYLYTVFKVTSVPLSGLSLKGNCPHSLLCNCCCCCYCKSMHCLSGVANSSQINSFFFKKNTLKLRNLF